MGTKSYLCYNLSIILFLDLKPEASFWRQINFSWLQKSHVFCSLFLITFPEIACFSWVLDLQWFATDSQVVTLCKALPKSKWYHWETRLIKWFSLMCVPWEGRVCAVEWFSTFVYCSFFTTTGMISGKE